MDSMFELARETGHLIFSTIAARLGNLSKIMRTYQFTFVDL